MASNPASNNTPSPTPQSQSDGNLSEPPKGIYEGQFQMAPDLQMMALDLAGYRPSTPATVSSERHPEAEQSSALLTSQKHTESNAADMDSPAVGSSLGVRLRNPVETNSPLGLTSSNSFRRRFERRLQRSSGENGSSSFNPNTSDNESPVISSTSDVQQRNPFEDSSSLTGSDTSAGRLPYEPPVRPIHSRHATLAQIRQERQRRRGDVANSTSWYLPRGAHLSASMNRLMLEHQRASSEASNDDGEGDPGVAAAMPTRSWVPRLRFGSSPANEPQSPASRLRLGSPSANEPQPHPPRPRFARAAASLRQDAEGNLWSPMFPKSTLIPGVFESLKGPNGSHLELCQPINRVLEKLQLNPYLGAYRVGDALHIFLLDLPQRPKAPPRPGTEYRGPFAMSPFTARTGVRRENYGPFRVAAVWEFIGQTFEQAERQRQYRKMRGEKKAKKRSGQRSLRPCSHLRREVLFDEDEEGQEAVEEDQDENEEWEDIPLLPSAEADSKKCEGLGIILL